MSMTGSRYPDMGDRKKTPGAFSPQAGGRVPQGEPRMAQPGRPHKKRRKSGREKIAFIDPDNMRMVSSKFTPVAELFELKGAPTFRQSSAMTPDIERKMRLRWVAWLRKLAAAANDAKGETMSQSKFMAGKRNKELVGILQRYCNGKDRPDAPREGGRTYHSGTKATYESMFDLAERLGGNGAFGIDLTHPPQKKKGVGTSPAASPPRQGSDMLGAGDNDDSRFKTHVPPGSAHQKSGDPRYKGKARRSR